jgi:hypothetical protein
MLPRVGEDDVALLQERHVQRLLRDDVAARVSSAWSCSKPIAVIESQAIHPKYVT